MNSAEWQKIKKVFNAAIDVPGKDRAAFLNQYDDGLRLEVEKLINANDDAVDFIDEPVLVEIGLVEENQADFYIGKQIDSYKILSEIGQGGMGTVYLANRADESFDKKVAVKLIKRGMDTNAILKRFMMERQILANLENPFIATLLDGGSTHDGLPYLVMEYVEGEPITKFCDSHGFSTRESLELFQKVCSAISYAHQNLVVHRDIKPSNILVTKGGTPKLLDFGIAKLLHPDWSLDTHEATATMFRVMTPEYASPEQIRGLPITTASDVYSLGVVLYELLTGERPYKIESRWPEEVAQIVLTAEPVKPSSVVSSRSEVVTPTPEAATLKNDGQQTLEDGHTPKPNIRNLKSLRGDLDNIILKALRKEPERRYHSVQEFSEDIRRHLEGLPVTATAATVSYRAAKFIQRHRVGVFATALIGLILVSATAITSWQAIAAKRERDRAEQRFNQVRKLANTVLFDYHERIKDMPGATAVREKMVTDSLEYLDNLSQEPGDNPELLKELSVAYRKVGDIQGDPFNSNIGQSSGALESYQKAFQLQERLLEANPGDVNMQREFGSTAYQIADSYYSLGNNEEALKAYRRAQSAYKIVSESDPANSRWKTSLASLYERSSLILFVQGADRAGTDDFNIAQQFNDEALFAAPEDSYVLLVCAQIYSSIGNNLGNPDFNDAGKPNEALEVLEKSLLIRKKLAEREPDKVMHQSNLGISFKDIGDIYLAKGNAAKAIENYRKALAIHQAIADKDTKDAFAQGVVAYDLNKLGNALRANGEIENALIRHEQSVSILERQHLANAENVMVTHTLALSLEGLANTLVDKKEFTRALATYQRSLQIEEELSAASRSPELKIKIGQLYFKLGQTRETVFNLKRMNESLCHDSQKDYQKSVETFTELQKLIVLSPTNLEMFSRARQGSDCSKQTA